MKPILLTVAADEALDDISDVFSSKIFEPAKAGGETILSAILHYHVHQTVDVPWRQGLAIGTVEWKIKNSLFTGCMTRLELINSRRAATEQLSFNDFVNSILLNTPLLLRQSQFRDTIREYILSEMKSEKKNKKLRGLILDLPFGILTVEQRSLKQEELGLVISNLLDGVELLQQAEMDAILADPNNQIPSNAVASEYKLILAADVKTRNLKKLDGLSPFHESILKLVKALNRKQSGSS